MPQPGKQVGRRRTMYADGGNIPQIDEESPLDIDAKVSFYNLSPAPTVIAPSPAAVATTATQQPSRSNNKRFIWRSQLSARTSVQCYRRD
jgi:hypothetical protein